MKACRGRSHNLLLMVNSFCKQCFRDIWGACAFWRTFQYREMFDFDEIWFSIFFFFWVIFFLSCVRPLYQAQQPRDFSPSFFFFFFGKNFTVSKFAFESMPHFVEFQYPLKTIPFPFYFSITFVLSHSSLLYWYVSISVFSILYTKLWIYSSTNANLSSIGLYMEPNSLKF